MEPNCMCQCSDCLMGTHCGKNELNCWEGVYFEDDYPEIVELEQEWNKDEYWREHDNK